MQTMVTEDEPARGAEKRSADVPLRAMLIIASLGTAAIHFAYAPHHLAENTVHGVFFLAIAWFALGWAAGLAVKRPIPHWFLLGAVVNAGIIGVWIVSRSTGISGQVETVGFPDVMATVLEGLIVLGSLALVTTRVPRQSVRRISSAGFIGVTAMATIALVTASMLPSVGGSHSGSSGDHNAAANLAGHQATSPAKNAASPAHDMATMNQNLTGRPYDPTQPIDLGGVPGVTPEQQAQAENIISETLRRLPMWNDPKVAEAAGYRSIGDGFTGIEHFVNQAFMNDDTILDPDKAESLVYSTKGGGRQLVAAMYMLKTGTPLKDAPTIGGKLMQWHVHDNLCYNAQGHVAGLIDAQGRCPAGLVKPPETPMIHVWLTPNKCGPFAALEGIGGGRIADGQERLCDRIHGQGA